MKGIVIFHSETGTEGGWPAFQDEEFMNIVSTAQWCNPGCNRVWYPDTQPHEPSVPDNDPDHVHNWRLMHPTGSWSYEGLHYLTDGDHLKIFDPAGNVVFEGVVKLDVLHPYTDPTATWGVFWMNRELHGIPRETQMKWFFDQYSAEYEKAEGGSGHPRADA